MLSVNVTHRQRYPNIARNVQTRTLRVAKIARDEAIKLTSGGVSSQQLAQMGHPFGRNAPSARAKGRRIGKMRGSLPRLPINRQTGELQQSLQIMLRSTTDGTRFFVQFTSPHAIVLIPGGTQKMAARGFWTAFHRKMKPALASELRTVFKP